MSTFNELIDFTRSTTGTYLGSDGLLKTAAVDEPRLEYDAQGNSLGLLIEEARTNLLLRSQEFDDDYWSKSASVIANQATAPDGTTTADEITFPVQNSNVRSPDLITTAGVTATVSVWLKNVDGNTTLRLRGSTSGGTYLQNITITNEWARYTATFTHDGTNDIKFALQDGNASNLGSVLIWGAQVEEGAFPTSYIPTSGSTVTRAVDSAVATLSDFYYRQKNGSMVVEFTSKYDESAALFKRVCEIGNTNTSANRIVIYVKTDETRAYSQVWDNNVFQAGAILTSSLPNGTGVYSKAALVWETNNAHAAFDGDLVGSADTSVSLTQTRDTLGIMRSTTDTANTLTGHIKSIQYYPLRVADAKLETLTS